MGSRDVGMWGSRVVGHLGSVRVWDIQRCEGFGSSGPGAEEGVGVYGV